MKFAALLFSAAAGALIVAGGPNPALAQDEVTILCVDNGVGCKDIQPIATAFEAKNPGEKINLQLTNYNTLLDSLPVQLAAGKGPDGAEITDLGGLSQYYLDLTPYVDAKRFEHDFGRTLRWLRGDDPNGTAINGMPTSLTVNGGYVNLTLFKQAGVPVPGDGATWEDWAKATQKVAKATGTDFAMEMDRSGHRFASLAISYGAKLVDDDGMPVVDEGLKQAITQFVQWHKDGIMPMDLWGAVGGATHRELFSDFLNANTVFYFGGSWTLSKMDKEVGDLFDWKVVPAPCGPSSCTVMPGGAALVAFKNSKHPEIVGKFIDYLAQPDNYAKIVASSVEIPASATVIKNGVDYAGASERTKQALATFSAQVPKMADAAFNFQGWRFERAMMNALTTRISQVLNDELTVDEALKRIKEDVDLAIKAAKNK